MSSNGNCRLAIPKKGRLYEKVIELLKGAGITFRRMDRLDVAECNPIGDYRLTLVFLPAADIAKYVGEGNVDIGITGYDNVKESEVENMVTKLLDLEFGKCKLCVQAPVASKIAHVQQLAGKRIVTSFPILTKQFFDSLENECTTKIRFVSGSVEAACGLGLADAVVDLVETGTTMKAAGLEIVHTVLETQAVLIANPHSVHPAVIELICQRITGYITATKYSMIVYNVANDLVEQAILITPGKRSPTITPLDDGESKSVSSLVRTSELNDKMDALHALGATDILVLGLLNTRM
jgi:ATP phosphoribosyltransferase